jgi:hypothetical protein
VLEEQVVPLIAVEGSSTSSKNGTLPRSKEFLNAKSHVRPMVN